MNRDNHFEHVTSIDCWGCSTSIIPTPVREPGLSQSSNLYIPCDAVVDSMNERVTVGNIYDEKAIWWVNKGCKRQRLGKPSLDRGEPAQEKETSRRCVIRKRKQPSRCPITTTMDKRIHEENHCEVHTEGVIYEESQNAVHTEGATHERNQDDVHTERHRQKGSQGTRYRMRDGSDDPGIVTHILADRDWIHQRNTRRGRQGITHTEGINEESQGDVHTEGVIHERSQGDVHTERVTH